MKVKILLDTDIGSDVDDAVCLAYLLANPDCELLGITTVTGEAVERAKMADAICKVAGRAVPIYPGTENPLLISPYQPRAPQTVQLKNWDHQKTFPEGEAILFLRDTIREYPNEVTLLCIGPLTNIALLFSLDPEIPSLLKSLVMMNGVFTRSVKNVGPQEWNAMLDPHATAIVYSREITSHRCIGLDVTMQVRMDVEAVKNRFQAPLLKIVADFAEVYFQQSSLMIFHDPLAATIIFDPEICEFQKGLVEVEHACTNERIRGMTLWTPDFFIQQPDKARHEVAMKVDTGRFFDHYFSMFEQ